MNSSPIISLRLFGNPAIESADGAPLVGYAAQRHRLALLALLALAPAQRLSRDKLMAYLWPESDPERARNLLKVSTYVLRTALGKGALSSAGNDLWLNTELLQVDVAEFETALERADYAHAVALYKASFLDGFFLHDAPEFEHWVERERERLAGAYAKALEALAEVAEGEQDYARAAEWWKARAAHDPYDSRAALRLMQALEASGNRAGALQHAAIHQRLLQEELGMQSAPEIAALTERLRSEPVVRVESSRERVPPVTLPSSGPEPRGLAVESSPAPPLPATSRLVPHRLHPVVWFSVAALFLVGVLFGAIWLGRTRSDAPAPAAQEPSIAVLPLINRSRDPEDAALADGITEDLIAMLAKTSGLRVIASTSAFAFRNRQLDVRSIADSLGVTHVLEGGVRKNGSGLRVQIRLVDARDGSMRWSETYDRELQDVFAVQDDIARAVARELGVRLGGATPTAPRPQHTQNVAAYELYLRGSDRALPRSDSGARQALEYFRQAIEVDSTYAAAWAGLGRMYARVAGTVPTPERERYYVLAEEAARKAVALDASLAEGHATLGVVRMRFFDSAAAERHLRRALALDPSHAITHGWMVLLYLWTGRPEQALAHAERALQIDPLSPYAHADVARALLGNDRCDEALAHLEKLAGMQPPLLRAAPIAALCYARKQRWPQAIAVLRPQAERGEPHALALLHARTCRAARGSPPHPYRAD